MRKNGYLFILYHFQTTILIPHVICERYANKNENITNTESLKNLFVFHCLGWGHDRGIRIW